MKKLAIGLLIGLSLGVGSGWWQFQSKAREERLKPIVYVVAHPDDDLLFMNPSIMNNLDKDRRVVVIYITVGDGGQDEDYWRERFKGIREAYGFLGKVNGWTQKEWQLNRHRLEVWLADNKKLQLVLVGLPDGGYRGEGFERNDYESLQKLWLGKIEKIKTVYGESYSWLDLVTTMKSLLEKLQPELVAVQDVESNYGEEDHSDHISGARLMVEVVRGLKNRVELWSYGDYEIKHWPENVKFEDWKRKRKALEIYLKHDEPAQAEREDWEKWSQREYLKWRGKVRQRVVRGMEVRNGKLVDDEGKELRLIGMATKAFRWKRLSYSLDLFWQRWRIARYYGANLVVAYIHPSTFELFKPEVDKLVAQANKEGFEVALIPVVDEVEVGRNLARLREAERFPEFMGQVAARYKDSSQVIYGVWTEPSGFKEKDYLKFVEETVKRIRQENPQAVVIVDGLGYGREIVGLPELKRIGKVILDVHDYPAANDRGLRWFLKKWKGRFLWEDYLNKGLPLMVGEFGGVWREDFGSDLDLDWIRKELERIEEKKVSYVMYTLDDEALGLFEPQEIKLNRKGKLWREMMMKDWGKL